MGGVNFFFLPLLVAIRLRGSICTNISASLAIALSYFHRFAFTCILCGRACAVDKPAANSRDHLPGAAKRMVQSVLLTHCIIFSIS